MDIQLVNLQKEFNPKQVYIDLTTTCVNKPTKAMWTSTAEFVDKSACSAWLDWCKYNMTGWQKGYKYLFVPKDEMKVYTINTWEDYQSDELVKMDDKKIDYIAMREKGYHAIHFTQEGAWLGHSFTGSFEQMMLLNSIDCESTVYLVNDWYEDFYLVTKN